MVPVVLVKMLFTCLATELKNLPLKLFGPVLGILQRRPQVVPDAPDWPVMTTGHIPELSDSWGRWDSAGEAASLSRHAARRARRPTLETGSGDLAFKI